MKPIVDSRRRQFWDVTLTPLGGQRFQPTGFPDIGAAEFRRPVHLEGGQVVWKDALLVESAQSMANHLEATGWDHGNNDQVAEFDGLPYVEVVDASGGFLTSSRLEAHRLASAFVRESTIDAEDTRDYIRRQLGLRDDHPISRSTLARGIMTMDPLCLVHGVFFTASDAAKFWPGQPKIARALTGFVEAVGVEPVHSGGVKRDLVVHSVEERPAGGTREGYGTVPFHRTEYTAESIVASFSLDRQQIASYGLGAEVSHLLETIARWELRALLDQGLRLRTACDLAPVSDAVADQDGTPLASLDELTNQLREAIGACADQLGDGRPIQVEWNG